MLIDNIYAIVVCNDKFVINVNTQFALSELFNDPQELAINLTHTLSHAFSILYNSIDS